MRHKAFWPIALLGTIVLQGSAAAGPVLQADTWSDPIEISGGVTENWRAFGTSVCDPYQNLHIFWLDNGEDSSAVYYRNDIEGVWSEPRDVIVAPDYLNYDLVAVAANDHLHLAWRGSSGGVYYTTSLIATAANPLSWSPPQMLDAPVFNVALAVGPDGTLHMMYGSPGEEALDYDVIHRTSLDNGEAWSDAKSVFATTFPEAAYVRTEMAIDAANRIHVGLTLRSQDYGLFSEVGYLRSQDGGRTWDPYRQIDARTESAPGIEWIAPYAFDGDEVHLTWHDPRRMHQWSMDGGETWGPPIVITDLGAAFGGRNALARDAAGSTYAVTAWSDGVFVSRWFGSYWGARVPLDLRRIDAHGQQITVCQGNVLHVLYYDRTGDTAVWYSSRTTAAAHQDRLLLPAPPTARPPSTAGLAAGTSTAEVDPTTTVQPSLPAGHDRIVPIASPQTPILVGALSVLALLAAVIALRIRNREI